jgi:alkylated DNA repair dioxygenase AlkB
MLFKIYGRSLEYPLDKAFYGCVTVKNGERVEPFYKCAKDTAAVKSWAGSVLEQVAAGLKRSCGQPCNHVVVNQYQSGADYIGAHHDKPATFHPGSSVLTLSLGGERTLRLTCVKGLDVGRTHDLRLAHGSLFVLGPVTNKCWKHAILKDKKAEHRRVSLTYRQIEAVRKTQIDAMDLTQHE